jgi:hypothetical protein
VKTISVKEAAEALGIGPRAVQYKLQNGDLKGTRTKNQYGVAEWRVWPTKEIAEALKQKHGDKADSSSDPMNFSPNEGDTIEAEEVSDAETAEGLDEPTSWRQVEMERLEIMAEKLVKPLAERIEAQAVALREQEKVIEDQNRQLRLLPDFQKQAEDERKAAQLRAMEVEALNKQIAAMEEEKQQLEVKANEATALASDLQLLKTKVEELQKPWWKKMFQGE